MKPRLCVALALLLPFGAPRPVQAEDVVDLVAIKPKLKLVSDGKKHYLAFLPKAGLMTAFFYGDGATFYEQLVPTAGSSADGFDSYFWEPRVAARYKASFSLKGGKYELQCDDRKTELKEVAPAEQEAILGRAQLKHARWQHRAHALARDDSGRYFYVDTMRDPKLAKSFRLFMGPKGALKLLKMVNVVSDSQGEIFSTKKGELRLVLDKHEYTWIAGKTRTKLVSLPIEDNRVLIYSDLGVYAGEPLGTPCDDL